jgi:HK97 family phage major capsid protein
MSDIDKLMGKLDEVDAGLRDYKKSTSAEIDVAKNGVAEVQKHVEDVQKQLQEFKAIAQRGIEPTEREIFAGFGKMLVDIKNGKAASEGTNADGGYLVADEWSTKIKSAQNQYGTVRKVYGSDVYPMASDVTYVPVDTFEDTATNAPVPVAVSENAQISASQDPQLAQITLTAQKYATLNPISNELLDDAFVDYLGAYLMPKLARKAAKIEDQVVFTTATTGLLNSANVLSHTLSSTAFEDLDQDDLIDAMMKVVDDADENGMFIMHKTLVGKLRKLKGTDNHPIWTPMAAGEPATILGRPYMTSSVFPSLSSSAVNTGFILYGDPVLGSVFGERLGRRVALSKDFKFDYDQTVVRMTFRIALGTNANIGRALCAIRTAAA